MYVYIYIYIEREREIDRCIQHMHFSDNYKDKLTRLMGAYHRERYAELLRRTTCHMISYNIM